VRSVQVRPQIKDPFPWRPHSDNEAMVTHARSVVRELLLQRAVMITAVTTVGFRGDATGREPAVCSSPV
jgi:hypothetical protein